VSIVKPFRALRPVPEKAECVSCIPYDIVSESEVRELLSDNPISFLRVTRPEAGFSAGSSATGTDILKKAGEELERLISDGIMAQETEPCLYVYRLAADGRQQTGIVGCCSLDDYDQGIIKKHEKTRPDKVRDRTDHMLSLKAQTGLIFLAFRGTVETRKLIAEVVAGEPLYDFACPKGVRQTVWRVTQPESLVDAFGRIPSLYIADGHHRAESAALARREMRDGNPNHNGTEEYNFVMAGIFPAEDLTILAYNRVVKDLNGLTEDAFLENLRQFFIVSESSERSPQARGEFCMYLGGKWYGLQYIVNNIRETGPLDRLDVQILQQAVLHPILGIDDPRTNERIIFVGGGRGIDELENLVDAGDAKVAFTLFPTTMDDLFAVSDMGEIMPPKSTWFEPKLKDGLFVHLI
jgi:uncharacterized protein (DUF1015 family)